MNLASYGKTLLQFLAVTTVLFLPSIVFGQTRITSTELEQIIEKHKGDVVVVAFWATVDKPSRRQLPELNTIYEKYKDRRVQFLGVSYDEQEKRWWRSSVVKQFAKEHNITFPLYKVKDKEDISHNFNIKQIPTLIYYFSFGKRGHFKQYLSEGYTAPGQIEEDLNNCLEGIMPRSENQPARETKEQSPSMRP